MRVGADISGTKISVARWVLIYRNVLAAPQRASKVLRYIRLCQVVAHSPGIIPATPTRYVASAVSRTPVAARTPTSGLLLVCTSYLFASQLNFFACLSVNRAVPGAGTDHDRDTRSTFSMHQALSSGGNGAAAAAAAAIIAHAKINRVRSGGGSSGGSSSSSSGLSRVGGSSSGGGPSSGQQKRTLDISNVSGGGRGQAAPPGMRSGAGPGSTAKNRRRS
jgi:uncharacterized membrane protein YgcG